MLKEKTRSFVRKAGGGIVLGRGIIGILFSIIIIFIAIVFVIVLPLIEYEPDSSEDVEDNEEDNYGEWYAAVFIYLLGKLLKILIPILFIIGFSLLLLSVLLIYCGIYMIKGEHRTFVATILTIEASIFITLIILRIGFNLFLLSKDFDFESLIHLLRICLFFIYPGFLITVLVLSWKTFGRHSMVE